MLTVCKWLLRSKNTAIKALEKKTLQLFGDVKLMKDKTEYTSPANEPTPTPTPETEIAPPTRDEHGTKDEKMKPLSTSASKLS